MLNERYRLVQRFCGWNNSLIGCRVKHAFKCAFLFPEDSCFHRLVPTVQERDVLAVLRSSSPQLYGFPFGPYPLVNFLLRQERWRLYSSLNLWQTELVHILFEGSNKAILQLGI